VAKPEWGVKRACLACGARFYDMQKSPTVCPSCETVFDPEAIFRPRRNRPEAPAPANDDAAKPAAAAGKDTEDAVEALISDVVVEDDDEDEDDDAPPALDDDDDDEAEVVLVPKPGVSDDT
jgi:uncharacterized protein (TIGR02300 family)